MEFTARGYDKYYDPAPGATSPLLMVPRSGDDLRALIPMLHDAGMMAHVTSTSIQTLKTAAGRMHDVQPDYIERMDAYIDEAQHRDVRITQCITDAKGDRSRPPAKQDDPDMYVRVVDRQRDGVVIRGAKLHITGASFGHDLLTIPTKAMKAGEEDWSIGCIVPVNAEGVKIINTTYAPRHADVRAFPVSGHSHYPEGFVIFDDVFVPNERMFLDGETAYAAVFAHSLGLWERLGGLSAMADGGRRARRPGRADGRGQRARGRVAHQGEDLRDDHPRHAHASRRWRPPSPTATSVLTAPCSPTSCSSTPASTMPPPTTT